MAETIKSALFVDYDSFHRMESAGAGEVAERLAQTAAAWVAAIEAGKLVLPPPENGARRRVLIRRCYADPALLGLNRSALIASGFEVIDCPHHPGRKRNAADLHMVIDTLDALDHPAGYDEFILLSADADFTPVLLRLRAHNRNTVIYGDDSVTAAYKAIADGMVDAGRFGALLAGEPIEDKPEPQAEETPADSGEAAPPAPVTADRTEIEALARKVHAATNVPMFSPRTFADLFRVLAQEIGEHGYHFQNTAENVTERLVAAGRNINRRQVVFVVKGLALKGHVFSTTDTPDRLAEVFREQVLYLIGNAGIELDEREKVLLPMWIIGRSTLAARPAPTATPPRPVTPTAEELAARKISPPIRRRATRSTASAKDEAPEDEAVVGLDAIGETEPEPESEPATGAASPAKPEPAAKAAAKSAQTSGSAQRSADLRASVASRFAAITKGSFGAKSNGDAPVRANGDAPVKPRPPVPRPPAGSGKGAASRGGKGPKAPTAEEGVEKDALESSILAAIAQAVDVLVDDDGNKAKAGASEAEPGLDEEMVAIEVEDAEFADMDEDEGEGEDDLAAADDTSEPPPDPEPSPGGESEDIGDEIQRIIASYSRARQKGS